MSTLTELALNFWDLFLDSAPWLLLGLFMAGMIKMFVPMSWMQKQLGGHGIKPTVKAAVFGAPLPLCSCGVIPAAVGLRRSGASKSATTAFLVATPETGVDSVSVSYVLLGPFMAVVRPITAVVSAIVAGLLVGRDQDAEPQPKPAPKMTPMAAGGSMMRAPDAVSSVTPAKSGCCASQAAVAQPAQQSGCCGSKAAPAVKAEATGCCSSKAQASAKSGCCGGKTEAPAAPGVVAKLIKGVHYAATDLVRDTTVWLLVGLFFAALVNTFVPASFLSQWGDGILAMTVMVLVSIPMYICATASTPIAAGLLLAGVSPGAVLVFMMAGPATNIATLGVVRNELGKRALWAYLTGVIGTAMLFGFAVDFAVAEFGFKVMPLVGEEHRMLPHALVYGSGVLLAVLMAKALWDKWVPAKAALA
ncbi:SO_0444 family Cu/Zn efflux transporter [Ferrimonas balearica]|uniref:SO_0444 family Cu/Zn efflux transporter n=1 Tax=Ferrimonas balearica TaxID=44012 RepID=UPI001C991CCC|nr:SO_0444 family Cu/Zn efflux transporter [Ferrimonas balearica]MBY5992195.1 SO_0444 family Cu/Zn efflux transporter [Ferrimonas balearica]